MTLSPEAEREFRELAESDAFRKDMETVRANRHNPFVRNGVVDVDAYLEFVQQYNEFINHEPKPFKPMIDKDMRL
jgi:hypothetical protein